MKHVSLGLCLITLPLAMPVAAADPPPLVLAQAGETTDTDPLFPFLEEFAERTEESLRDLLGEIGPEMEQMLSEMLPRLQDLAAQVGGLINYELPEILPNGDIIIRRKRDAPPLPEGFVPDNAPIEL